MIAAMRKPAHLTFSLATALLFATGLCGCSSPCDTIVDKLNECNGTDLEANPNCDDDAYECQADCYDEASCDEIQGLVPAPNAFQECVQACGGQ